MSATTSSSWYAEGLRFTCTQCGRCCKGPTPGVVWVSSSEAQAMAAHLGLELDAFGRKYLRRVGARLSLIEDAQNDCIFWSNAEGCTIYAVRPGQCRQFPFWPELLESEAAWDAEQERCPGMGAGQHYSADEVEAICAGKGETGSHPPPTPPNETLTV